MSSGSFGDKKPMKVLFSLVALGIFCGTPAFGQSFVSSAANGQAQMLTMAGNPQHAAQTEMAEPHDLLERSRNTWAQGELPLWEVMPEKTPGPPLGDVARALRNEHATAQKATKIWTN
jgi:hypothetical protein